MELMIKVIAMRIDYGDWRNNICQTIRDGYNAVVTFNEDNEGCHVFTDLPSIVEEFQKNLDFLEIRVIRGIKCYYTSYDADFLLGWIGNRFLSPNKTIVVG